MSDIMEELDGPGWYSMTALEQDVLRLKAVKEIKQLRSALRYVVKMNPPLVFIDQLKEVLGDDEGR